MAASYGDIVRNAGFMGRTIIGSAVALALLCGIVAITLIAETYVLCLG